MTAVFHSGLPLEHHKSNDDKQILSHALRFGQLKSAVVPRLLPWHGQLSAKPHSELCFSTIAIVSFLVNVCDNYFEKTAT